MIEYFKSRRMICLTLILMGVSIVILILEGIFTSRQMKPSIEAVAHHQLNSSEETLPETQQKASSSVDGCWTRESFSVIKSCVECSDSDKNSSKYAKACRKTGFREEIKCSESGTINRSCDMSSSQFLKFEFLMIASSVLGVYFCKRREAWIEKESMDRINRQVSAGF